MVKRSLIGKIIFTIAFMIPVVFFGLELKTFLAQKDAINNGIETTAIVYDYSNDTTENDIPLYSLYYRFYDENGNIHEGKTSCDYLYDDVEEIMDGTKEISIKYNPDTFDSVQSSFSGKPNIALYILPIFGLISVYFIFSMIKDVIVFNKHKKIIKEGTRTQGQYLGYRLYHKSNSEQYYYVQYSYKDNQGVQQTTISKYFTFNSKQITMMEQKGVVDVAYLGNESTIIFDDIYKNSSATSNNNSSPVSQVSIGHINVFEEIKVDSKPVEKKKCEYCGEDLPDGELVCPKCGARNFAD